MYASRADFEQAFGVNEASDLEGTDVGRVDAALLRAGAECDAYLAARYSTPVLSVNPALEQATVDIARYRLWDDRASDEVRRRYEDALRWLRDVSKGLAALTDASGALLPTGGDKVQAPAAASVRTTVYGSAFESQYNPTAGWFA